MKRVELGVFLPVAKNGFVISTHSPAYHPSYSDNLEISLLAEEIGMDYVFSMAKWRGFGGQSEFWDASFESFSLMAALAAATTRVGLIATVNPVLFHPVLMAKMAATIDDVSGGRLGLNIVTGSTLGEYTQMGVLPADYDRQRYAFAQEWVHVLKRLWTEANVTHEGQYFSLHDCVSDPKPRQKPHPLLVCAATSEEGLRFTARHADMCFLNGSNGAEVKTKSRRVKEIAGEEGTVLKTAIPAMLVLGDTRAEAERYWEYLIDGADVEAIANAGRAYRAESRERAQAHGAEALADKRLIHRRPVIGSASDIAATLIDLAVEGEVDSILFEFPDYLDGMTRFHHDVMPLLREVMDVGQPGGL